MYIGARQRSSVQFMRRLKSDESLARSASTGCAKALHVPSATYTLAEHDSGSQTTAAVLWERTER